MKYALLAVLLLASLFPIAKAQAPEDIKHLSNAVVTLYSQDEQGGMRMTCTATAYKKILNGYRFASAAHCVEGDDDSEQADQRFFIMLDTAGTKTFIPAKLLKAGDKMRGDDFSIFEVITPAPFEVIELGTETTLELGDRVYNVSGPLGLGKQYFEGYISSAPLDRPKLDAGDVAWRGSYLVSIGGGPGSSGSVIVSVKQKAIVGFFVGSFQAPGVGHIVIPVSQFKAFEASVDAKTYKKEKRNFLSILLGSFK